jgi:cytochrome b6-f complex iron-sulfur subunit
MGCTPDWVGEDGKFECPCHGSQYTARGEVVEGPAPEVRFPNIGRREP